MFFLWKKYIHPPPIRIHPPYLYISIIKSVHYELELKIKFWVIVCKFCIYWYGQVLRSLSFADVPIIIQCNLWGKKYCVLLRYIIIFDKSRSFLLVENIHCFLLLLVYSFIWSVLTIITVHLLHRSGVPASVGKARVMLVTSQPLQNTNPSQQQNNNNNPKRL